MPTASYELTIDSKGNLYAIGNNGNNLYVKFDKNGNILGQGKIKDQDNLQIQTITAVAIDKKDNFYVGGSYITNRTDGGRDYTYNAYIQKMDAMGNLLWFINYNDAVNSSPDMNESSVSAINVDDAGNIYATGGFKGKVDFADGTTLTSTGSDWNAYILKFKQPDWK